MRCGTSNHTLRKQLEGKRARLKERIEKEIKERVQPFQRELDLVQRMLSDLDTYEKEICDPESKELPAEENASADVAAELSAGAA